MTILKGETIGDNVVVGAGRVVVKDIPDNVIVRQNTELVIEEIRRRASRCACSCRRRGDGPWRCRDHDDELSAAHGPQQGSI
ncbi:MAG: hypothetical protein ACLUA4_01590 [Bifidobacterium sp.]